MPKEYFDPFGNYFDPFDCQICPEELGDQMIEDFGFQHNSEWTEKNPRSKTKTDDRNPPTD